MVVSPSTLVSARQITISRMAKGSQRRATVGVKNLYQESLMLPNHHPFPTECRAHQKQLKQCSWSSDSIEAFRLLPVCDEDMIFPNSSRDF